MSYDVIVIGGGLAGCSTAIQLARAGRRCLLLEKQVLPADKLCGEFLSVEVTALLERLGVLEAVYAAGAREIDETAITTADGAAYTCPLPGTALGVSRYRLDALLFEAAGAAGADVRDGTMVRSVDGGLEEGFVVSTDEERFEARAVVGAYGKRGLLDRKLGRPFIQERTSFVAFKGHYTGVDLGRRIELHAFDGGYCGLAPVEGGRVNTCWIAREARLREAGGDPEAMIDRALRENAALAARLDAMRRVSDGFLAVSQVSFEEKGCFGADLCMAGDTAAMIAPLCGDGMGMALRGAELAVPLLGDFLDGDLSASALRAAYTEAWEDEFRGRLRIGRWIHYGYVQPLAAAVGVRALRWMPRLGPWLIAQTRGPAGG